MKRRLSLALTAFVAAFQLASEARAHGAVIPPIPPIYGGPSDHGGTVSPGAGATPGPQTPGPSPATPNGPSGGRPGAGPGGGGPGTVPSGGPGAPGAGSGGAGATLEAWEMWWRLNKEPYLDLKRAVHSTTSTTADDELFASSSRGGPPSAAVVRDRIVPALRKLLDTERSNDIATGALVALARIGEFPAPARNGDPSAVAPDASAIPAFVHALCDANQEVAETAALALGILRSDEALQLLESLLQDDARGRQLAGAREVPLRTRAFAAYGLGLCAERATSNRSRQMIARALFHALQEDRSATSDVSVACVLALSTDPIACEATESTTAPWISRQTEIRALMAVFQDGSRRHLVRANAATALARLAQDAPESLRTEVGDLLLGALRKDPRPENEVVQSCVQALGVLGNAGPGAIDARIRAALARAFEDADVQARWFAMIALGEIGARGAGTAPAYRVASSAPGDAGEAECRNALLVQLARGRTSTRPWAAIALGLLERGRLDRGAPPSEPTCSVLRDAFVAARQRRDLGAASVALGLARDERCASILLARLEQTTEDTGQGYVALALGMIGVDDAKLPLRAIVHSSKYKPALLEQAAIALALLGDKDAGPEIAGLLGEAQGLAAQAALASALGFVGDSRSVDPLLHLLADKGLTSSARGFAATALGRVADPAPLPWYVPLARDWNWNAGTAALLSGNGTGLLEIL